MQGVEKGALQWFKHPFAMIKEHYLNRACAYRFLLLGSFPSQASRKNGFFYGNPKNAFWRLLGEVFDQDLSLLQTTEEKIGWLDSQKIALYDLVESYEGDGWYSTDQALFKQGKNHQYSQKFIQSLLEKNPQIKICATSRKVQNLLWRYFGLKAEYLPSPSPINQAFAGQRRLQEWKKILKNS